MRKGRKTGHNDRFLTSLEKGLENRGPDAHGQFKEVEMELRALLTSRHVMLFAFVLPLAAALGSGCAGGGTAGGEAIGSDQEANVFTLPPDGNLAYQPQCDNSGTNVEIHNPNRETGLCPGTDEFTFGDAVAACRADIKYFGYFCEDDFGDDSHDVTVYYGCCEPTPIPSGSYERTCNSCFVAGDTLFCSCQRINRTFRNTTLPLPCPDTDIANCDGVLKCTNTGC
jgi:hypothetical protein